MERRSEEGKRADLRTFGHHDAGWPGVEGPGGIPEAQGGGRRGLPQEARGRARGPAGAGECCFVAPAR